MTTLSHTINEFLIHCRIEKNLSKKTLKAYQTDLLQFNMFLKNNNHNECITFITKKELRHYLESIQYLKPKSIKRKVATLKALFNYLEFEDKLMINPFRKMRIKLKESKQLPVVMDMNEVIKIYKVIYAQINKSNSSYTSYKESIRNAAVIELLFATGARVSELSNLKQENINLYSANIIIKGKGDKERNVQICNKEVLAILTQYQNLYAANINKDGYFFINRFNKKLSEQSIRFIVKKFVTQARISKHVTPHTFRHSFATLLLEKDVDIKYIQSLLGHSSIITTQLYTHVNSGKQRQILTRHPRGDFSMA